MSNRLENRILNLTAAIRNAVNNRKEAGLVQKAKLIWVRRRGFNLNYTEDYGFEQFTPERSEQEIWDSDDIERFQKTVISAMDEYKLLTPDFENKSQMLDAFANAVAVAAFSGLGEQELARRARAFALELDGQPVPVTIKAFISGLSLADSPIRISDHLLLRRPLAEDVTERIILNEHGGFTFPLSHVWFSAIGEFTINAINTGAAQLEFDRLLGALTLFRAGGVAAPRYQMLSRSLLQAGGIVGSSEPLRSRFSYQLSSGDAGPVEALLRDIPPRLPDPWQPNESSQPAHIAFIRYKEALFQNGPSERAITSAITCLEALFLTEESELRHRLAQRVAIFLKVFRPAFDAQQVYHDVSKGYEIRSKFIHGSSLDGKGRPLADQLTPVLIEYARACTLGFLQLSLTKEKLLKTLDRALLDTSSVRELAETMATLAHR